MKIRHITVSDKNIYFEMSLDFFNKGGATLFPITTDNLEATFNEAINNSPFLEILIMEENSTIVGYGMLALYWSNEAGGMVTQLEEFYVLPSYRGKNYGNNFLSWLIDNYSSKCARFRLEACPNNLSAQKLYKKYGFEVLDYIQFIKTPSSFI